MNIKLFQKQEKIIINEPNALLVVDANTRHFCLPLLETSNVPLVEIEAGEENKSLASLEKIWSAMMKYQLDRQATVYNLGGGMITDLGGFAAATYQRGIRFVNIPTSLLAMIDASVGGKTGINFKGVKNQLGAFHSAQEIFLKTEFLETLPKAELLSGMGECLKHALLKDEKTWLKWVQIIEQKELPSLENIFEKIKVKEDIVHQDFKENGLRKKLNLGHTIGHALESASHKSNKALKHGEAVAFGIALETQIAVEMSLCTSSFGENINNIIYKMFGDLPTLSLSDITYFINKDKKNQNKQIMLVLLKDFGMAEIDVQVEPKLIQNILIKNGIR